MNVDTANLFSCIHIFYIQPPFFLVLNPYIMGLQSLFHIRIGDQVHRPKPFKNPPAVLSIFVIKPALLQSVFVHHIFES
jgi:hypothetical protein